jgi:hypothetical protein
MIFNWGCVFFLGWDGTDGWDGMDGALYLGSGNLNSVSTAPQGSYYSAT